MNIKTLVISVLFILSLISSFSMELKGEISFIENNNDSIQLDFLKRLQAKNQFSLHTIDSFLLQTKFTRELEKEILLSIVQKNPEAFFAVLDSGIENYRTSKLYKIFSNLWEIAKREEYKKIYLSIKNCEAESVYKTEILKAMSRGKRKRNGFLASALFTPTVCLGVVLYLNLKK